MELLVIACALLWGGALILLCNRRDIEIHNKLSWIVTILVLNAVGAVIYFIFGPKRKKTDDAESAIDADATPFTPEGSSWNPILGENPMPDGQGLNPKKPETTKEQDA